MLKVLPESIYSLIAAGEVIQRPASVVKELMENSADAGATSIMLVVSDYGKTLIQVIDNGIGMDAEEAGICFLSHATSKIDAVEDLQNLSTFGFRGEALASIAACADVTLKTRKRGEATGTQVHISGGKTLETTEIACPEGCNIAVRNLFFNIPARRKFLKSDNSEYRMIVSEFTRVALTRLDIEFRLISNSKEVITLPKGRNLKQRLTDLFGSAMGKQIVDINVDTTVVKLRGVIGTPQSAKKTQQNTFLFANGRYFRSPMLHKAVLKGYSNLIPEGNAPHYFIFLEVPPQEMDVNISPSKTEIKLENEQVIFQIVEAAVKEAIGKNAFVPAIDFDTEGVPVEISTGDGFTLTPEEKRSIQQGGLRPPKINYDPLFNPFEEEKKQEGPGYRNVPSAINDRLMEEPAERRIIQIDRNMVAVADEKGGLVVFNIARARQRIFYERYLKSLSEKKCQIQEELFPKTVSLDHSSFTTLMDNVDKVRSLGFEIRQFGKDCVVVSGTPADFRGEKFSIEECIEEIARYIEEGDSTELFRKAALDIVRHSNFSYTADISVKEASAVIDELMLCKEPTTSPAGGYTFFRLTADEIRKKLL
ncbi:MAG: DNA mismatch repair endonuclease MutL [Bacteroidales bacterium]|nr:DNA mismatch repair endonuclease MutL [Bacteroidales bacterium]